MSQAFSKLPSHANLYKLPVWTNITVANRKSRKQNVRFRSTHAPGNTGPRPDGACRIIVQLRWTPSPDCMSKNIQNGKQFKRGLIEKPKHLLCFEYSYLYSPYAATCSTCRPTKSTTNVHKLKLVFLSRYLYNPPSPSTRTIFGGPPLQGGHAAGLAGQHLQQSPPHNSPGSTWAA